MARPTPLSHGGSGWDTYIESVFTDLYGGGAGTPSPTAAYVADYAQKNLNLHYGATAGTDITADLASGISDLDPANSGVGGTLRFATPGIYDVNGAALSGTASTTSWLAQVLFPAIAEGADGVLFKIVGLQTPVFGAYSNYGKGVVLLGNAGLTSLATLSSTLSTAAAITTLPVSATSVPLGVGQRILLDDGTHTQVWTVATAAAAGATSLTVRSQVPNFAYPATTTNVKKSVAMFAVKASGTGTNAPNVSQILTSFSDLTIKCAAGGSGLDLLNSATVDIARLFLYRDSIRPTDGSVGLRLPAEFNGAVYVIRDTAVGSDTAGGFHYGYDVAELADFSGSTFAQNCTTAVYCRGGAWTRFEHLHVAGCTSIFSTIGASGSTQLDAKIHWEGGGLTAAQFCSEDTTLYRPLQGKVELDCAGDDVTKPQSLPTITSPYGGLSLNLRRSGDPRWSFERHPRDTFLRLIAAPTAAAWPGLTSDSLHGWRVTSGSFSITQQTNNGQLFSTSTGESTALVPVLDAIRGGHSRTIRVKYTPQATIGNSWWQFPVHQTYGGANNGQGMTVKAYTDQLFLAVNGSNVVNLTGVFSASTLATIDISVTVAPDGLPSRCRVYVNNVKLIDYSLSATQRATMTPGDTFPYIEDGVDIPNGDQTSYLTLFSVSDLYADGDPTDASPIIALAQSGGGTKTPDASTGVWQTITVTDATAFTIGAPAHPPSATTSQELVIEVYNNSGGALGAITWNAAYVFNGFTWTSPANTKRRFAKFGWNGANWVCTGIAGADY